MSTHLRRKRRTAALTAAQHKVTARITHLATSATPDGGGDLIGFIDGAAAALHEGYQDAMGAGSEHAAADIPDTPTVDFQQEAAARAQTQHPFLMNLATALAAGTALDVLDSRIGIYGQTLVGAYNAAYGQTVQSAHPDYEIVWELGETEHCDACLDRAGKVYTFRDLPGWPGDGEFNGDICRGGPRCGCTLSYREGGQELATGENTQRPDSLDYYDQQRAEAEANRIDAQQARSDFLDTLPGDRTDLETPMGQAFDRDSIRQAIADQFNAIIRQSGGYEGVSIEPGDIPADLVAEYAHKYSASEPRDAQGRWAPGGADKPTYENTQHMTDGDLAQAMAEAYTTNPEHAAAIEQILDQRDAQGETFTPQSWGQGTSAGTTPGASNGGGRPAANVAGRMKEGAAAEYDRYAMSQYSKALEDLNGVLLNEAGKAYARSGHTGLEYQIFRSPWSQAQKYASEELKQWWLENGRETHSSFRYGLNHWSVDRAAAQAVAARGHSRTRVANINDRSQQ